MQIPDHGCLRKVEPGHVHFLEFKSAPDLMSLGYEEAKAVLASPQAERLIG